MKRAIIVFAKEPIVGMVKTRLQNVLSQNALLKLYKAFVKDTLNLARDIRCSLRILAYSAPDAPRFLKRNALGFDMIKQKGDALGERLHNAFKYAKNVGSKKTVIIGSDSPTLPKRYIEKAFRALETKDLVFGPATDGGYYLVGLKEPCSLLFQGIKWSSASVLQETLTIAKRLNLSAAIIEPWYDIDQLDGYSRLKSDLKDDNIAAGAQNTQKVVKL